jgi:hypothetical protein
MRVDVRFASLIIAMSIITTSVAAAEDGPPRRLGPAFGSNRIATTIDPVGRDADVDDYVAALAKGERLFVTVAADAKSPLFPTIALVDPSGALVDPGAKPRRGGRTCVVANFVVGASGEWTVRVGATDASATGDYVATFKIVSPRPWRSGKRTLGGDAPSTATHAFDAVDGSLLSYAIRSSGGVVSPRSLVDPAGRDVPLPAGGASSADVRLAGGDGTYALTVGVVGGAADGVRAAYSLVLSVRPPPRPKGKATLGGAEPYLPPRASPLDVVAGGAVRLSGAHFPTSPPYPAVYLGGARASVASVGPFGSWLDVGAPSGAVGDVFDVVVRNPDGQGVARSEYVRLVAKPVLDVLSIEPRTAVLQEGAAQDFVVSLTQPAPPLGVTATIDAPGPLGALPTTLAFPGGATIARFRLVAAAVPVVGRITVKFDSTVSADVIVSEPANLASIAPTSVHLLEGASVTFTATLDAPAPPVGLDVAVAATGGVGTVPASLHFAAGATSATFVPKATNVRANGKVAVSSADALAADVFVAPPDSIDLSGWTIVQQNSSATFAIPAGTTLHEGGYLVVGRKATRGEFETFWGRTLGADVVYLNALDQFLVINGSETFELRDASGASVDGPSVAMPAAAGAVLRRVPGSPAQSATAWTTASASSVSNATPGSGQTAFASPIGVYISEFADAVGTGNYVYEFVEVYFDRLP